jgi:hypothetical protein
VTTLASQLTGTQAVTSMMNFGASGEVTIKAPLPLPVSLVSTRLEWLTAAKVAAAFSGMFLGGVAPMPNVQLGVQAVTPNQVTNIANAGNVQNNYTINVTAPNGDPQAIADVIRRELDNRDRIARAGGVPTRRF